MKAVVFPLVLAMLSAGALVYAEDKHDHKHKHKDDTPTTAPTTQASGKPVNTKCPVMGGTVDPEVTTVYEGKTIAFCCPSCIPDFKKDPEKYAKKLK